MITSPNDKIHQKVTNGNYLQNSRNATGAAIGCIAGGIVLLVFAVLLEVPFLFSDMSGGGLFFAVICCVPGLLLTLIGVYAKNRRKKNYLTFYKEKTGFDTEELRQLEEELKDPSSIVTSYMPKEGNQKGPVLGGIITKNYFVMPMIGYDYVSRLRDMVCVAYSDTIPGIGGYKFGLVFLSSHDQDAYINGLMKKADCMELIGLLSERNPAIITSRLFSYEGKQYDVLQNHQEVIQLHKKLLGK